MLNRSFWDGQHHHDGSRQIFGNAPYFHCAARIEPVLRRLVPSGASLGNTALSVKYLMLCPETPLVYTYHRLVKSIKIIWYFHIYFIRMSIDHHVSIRSRILLSMCTTSSLLLVLILGEARSKNYHINYLASNIETFSFPDLCKSCSGHDCCGGSCFRPERVVLIY
jgi:hypothetical protein